MNNVEIFLPCGNLIYIKNLEEFVSKKCKFCSNRHDDLDKIVNTPKNLFNLRLRHVEIEIEKYERLKLKHKWLNDDNNYSIDLNLDKSSIKSERDFLKRISRIDEILKKVENILRIVEKFRRENFVSRLSDIRETSYIEPHLNYECSRTINGYDIFINSLELFDQNRLLSVSQLKLIKLIDINTGDCLKTFEGHLFFVNSIIKLNDCLFASGSSDESIKIWDINTGDCINTLQVNGLVDCLKLLRNGLLTSGCWNKIKIWDYKTGECLKTLKGHTDCVLCLEETSEGHLISGSSDSTIKIWDQLTGENLKSLQAHSSDVNCLKFIGSHLFVSGSKDKTIRIWDINEDECLKTFQEHTQAVSCIDELADEKIVSGSHDGTFKIWDHKTGLCLKTVMTDQNLVTCLTVTTDGKIITGGTKFNLIKFWKK